MAGQKVDGWTVGAKIKGHKIASMIVSPFLIFQIQDALNLTLGHKQFRLKWIALK